MTRDRVVCTDSLLLPSWASVTFWPPAMPIRGLCSAPQGQSLFVPHTAWCTPLPASSSLPHGDQGSLPEVSSDILISKHDVFREGHCAGQPGGEDTGLAPRRLESSWPADIPGHPWSA